MILHLLLILDLFQHFPADVIVKHVFHVVLHVRADQRVSLLLHLHKLLVIL